MSITFDATNVDRDALVEQRLALSALMSKNRRELAPATFEALEGVENLLHTIHSHL